MKKRVLALVLPMLLCGCGADRTETTSSEPTGSVEETEVTSETAASLVDEYICGLPEIAFNFETEETFLASEFCEKMLHEGVVPHVLTYDPAKYELKKILADASFYEYQFLNKENGVGVSCTVSYYIQEIGLFDLYSGIPLHDRENDVRTTVDKDGETYDVYIAKSDYSETGRYTLQYLPLHDFSLSIRSDASTPEEALAYIHEFDLVPVEEGTVATEVSVESDTAS